MSPSLQSLSHPTISGTFQLCPLLHTLGWPKITLTVAANTNLRKSSCAGFSWRRAIIWAKQPERVADNGAALHYNARETMTLQCNVNASAQYKILTRSVHPRVGLLCGIKFRAKPRDSKVQSKCKSAPGDTLPMQIQMFLQDNPAEPSQSPPPSNVL